MKNTLKILQITGYITIVLLYIATGGIPPLTLMLGLVIFAIEFGESTPRKRRIKGWLKALKFWMLT